MTGKARRAIHFLKSCLGTKSGLLITLYFRHILLRVEPQNNKDTMILINEEKNPNLPLPFHPELLFLSVEGAQTAAYQLQNIAFSNLMYTALIILMLFQCLLL